MNIASSVTCSVALLFLAACGGDAPKSEPPRTNPPAGEPTPAVQQPVSQAPVKPEPAAAKPSIPRPKVDYLAVKQLFGSDPPAPKVDNPSTPEKVALGKALYFDQHVSKNGNLSCNSCHDLSTYGVDNKPVSMGSVGQNGERNSPTTYNAFRQFAQFWDGRAATVEEQALKPVLNPVEHGIADEAELAAKLKAVPELVALFQKAFPDDADPVTAKNFGLAVGAFERTLVTKSKWDEYLDGNQKALSNEELLGLKTFMEVGCTTCHITKTLGGQMFQKLGLIKPYATEDTGRMQVTKQESDKFLFKVPMLLNVDKTAPYYHDGKIATLAEAVKDMGSLQLGRDLTNDQVNAIVAFLKATTGAVPAEFAAKK